jgi:hypothetical protein
MRMFKTVGIILTALSLAGCGQLQFGKERQTLSAKPPEGTTRPQARPDTLGNRPPPPGARTAEQFDTTTAEERQKAAAAPAAGGEKRLGETVASLGDPSRPGFWLETPLVTSRQQGRIVNPATGKTAQVELVPIEGAPGAGSRISLAAMRLIEVPLTDLPTLEVFAGGA